MKKKIGNTMNIRHILFILLALTFTSYSYAKVTATVDRNQIVVGETFNLTISVDENTNEQPDLSELGEVFRILGSSQSSSTKIINGDYSVEKSWQISLMPNGPGDNTIPPIRLGNEMTKPIQIKVRKSDPNAKANGDVFIELSTDKTNAYVKEQIIVTIKLFYAIALSEGNLSEPNASNSIVTQLDKGATYNTNRNGKVYTVVERHYAMFAEKSGQLDINPIIFNGRDNSSRRSFSMFSTGKPVRAISKPLSINIKPIPQSALGKDWIPARQVRISQEWSKGPYTVGEPITRTITLYVEGLSETQIPDIDLGKIDNIRIYPEQPQTQTEKSADTLKSWKQMKIAMIPTHEGAIRIPEFQLQWFNTKTQKIEEAKLPPITLQVAAGNFSAKQPDMTNLLNNGKQDESSSVSATTDKQQTSIAKDLQVVEKDTVIWKMVSAVLGLLWLLTLIVLFKKKTNSKREKVTKIENNISKKQLNAAINNKDIQRLQNDLIQWWNKQYPNQTVNNLSQIKNHVNSQMQALIELLESQLYSPEKAQSFNQKAWIKQVNGKGLVKVHNQHKNSANKLPNLY
jgi:hypothetical protein